MLRSLALALALGSVLLKQALGQRVCVTGLGCVRGVEIAGYFEEEKFEAFMGIPYAMKPIFQMRFQDPVPLHSWNGELDGTVPKPDCIQKDYLLPTPRISGEEDCLYLNVYRPKVRRSRPNRGNMPVMVFFHGGGFFSGSASPRVYGPEYFMDSKQVILVTVAYRLGPFGFLSTCDDNMPGNFGLKDQNIALKWVQRYIYAFGGDPRNVTIFGHGAGGVAVHLHMLSKKSRGLFQKAIVMSGNAASPFYNLTPDPLQQVRNLSRLVGIYNAHKITTKNLADNLREVEAERILDAGDAFKEWHVDPLIVYRPVIEFPSEDAFLTADPKFIIASGQYKKVPWMTGFVTNEGSVRSLTILANDTLRDQFNMRFVNRFIALMELPPPERTFSNKLLLQKYYFDQVNQLTEDTYRSFMDSLSERGFLHPFFKTVQQFVTTANLFTAPVYLYKFNYRGIKSHSNIHTGKLLDYGVVHGDDLIYLFRSPKLFPTDFKRISTEAKVIAEMVDIYVTFAKTGKPKRAEYISPCDRKSMTGKDKICDYWEISNRGTSFDVKIKNDFDKSPIRLWDRIVDLLDWCYY